MAKTETASQEVALGFNADGLAKSDELYAITSYDEAISFLGLDSVSPEDAADLLNWDTNPYEPVAKEKLIGVPLLLVQWRFVAGDFGEFVVVHAIARLGNGSDWLVLFTDGGVGIKQQLNSLTNSRMEDDKYKGREQQGALVRGGLSPSDYEVEVNGEQRKARTYYLSNTVKAA